MEISHGFYTNQTNIINPYNALLLKVISTGFGANITAVEQGIGTIGGFDGKKCLISLNLSGTITIGTKPVKIILCNQEIAVFSSGNSRTTIYCKDFQYYLTFDKGNIIRLDNIDGRADIFGTMIITELNFS